MNTNKAINNLKYTGRVTLSQYINGKKIEFAQIHNSGGDALFNFLYDCLLGDFNTAKSQRPTQIMLLQVQGDGGSFVARSSPILVRNTAKINNGVRYSFLIDGTLIDNSFSHIGLYSALNSVESANEYAAIIALPDNFDSAGTDPSVALVVDWELHFSNGNSYTDQVGNN